MTNSKKANNSAIVAFLVATAASSVLSGCSQTRAFIGDQAGVFSEGAGQNGILGACLDKGYLQEHFVAKARGDSNAKEILIELCRQRLNRVNGTNYSRGWLKGSTIVSDRVKPNSMNIQYKYSVSDAQMALELKHCKPGSIDNRFGNGTAGAIMRLNQAQRSTRNHLRVSQQAEAEAIAVVPQSCSLSK